MIKPRPDSIFHRRLWSNDEIEIHPIGEDAMECLVTVQDVGNRPAEIIMTLEEVQDMIAALAASIS